MSSILSIDTTRRRLSKVANLYRDRGLSGLTHAFVNRRNGSGPIRRTESRYVMWLTFANAGMLTPGNVDCFDYVIRNLPSSAPMVEIGSFCGLSTNVIIHLKEKHKVKNLLFTCDRWLFEGAESGVLLDDSLRITHDEYRHFVRESFLRNVQMFSRNDLPHTIEVVSDEFFSLWADSARSPDVFDRDCQLGGPISFCYIDGNHSYEFARRDFENCDRHLQAGGFILFDDSADGSGWEVCKVVWEVIGTKRYEVVARSPNYLFRKLS